MSADRIRVTVDGEPVTREVNWEQVRAYLRAKGWELRERLGTTETWAPTDGPQPRVWLGVPQNWTEAESLAYVAERIAEEEGRPASSVLRDIARGTEPSGVEPLSEETLAAIESDPGGGADASIVRRLVATVRAREAAMQDAVLTEREACATVAEEAALLDWSDTAACTGIAAAIRSRGRK